MIHYHGGLFPIILVFTDTAARKIILLVIRVLIGFSHQLTPRKASVGCLLCRVTMRCYGKVLLILSLYAS
jgi:hypothetical protein